MNINSVKKLTDNKWLNLFEVDFSHNEKNCKWQFASRKQEYIKSDAPDAVIVVPITEQGDFYLIKEFRVPIQDYELAFPAGLIDKNENISDCASRELFEETGLKIERILKISPTLVSSAGLSDEKVVMVFAIVSGTPTNEHTEGTEEIEVLKVPYNQFGDFINDPPFLMSAKTWPILFGGVLSNILESLRPAKTIPYADSSIRNGMPNPHRPHTLQ
jgi:ADP-ribose pyrophosphatase